MCCVSQGEAIALYGTAPQDQLEYGVSIDGSDPIWMRSNVVPDTNGDQTNIQSPSLIFVYVASVAEGLEHVVTLLGAPSLPSSTGFQSDENQTAALLIHYAEVYSLSNRFKNLSPSLWCQL